MRIFLFNLLLITGISAQAQLGSPLNGLTYAQRGTFSNGYSSSDSNKANHKWSLYKYAGISTGFSFMNGASATMFSVPFGLQLNRRLNNNLYGFVGLSAAPVIVNLNSTVRNPAMYKNNPLYSGPNMGNLGLYSRFEAGLMYISNDKTFSISGSIGIERNTNTLYPPYNNFYQQKQHFPATPVYR